MPRRLTIAPHLPVETLQQRSRAATDPVERAHYHMVWLVAAGHPVADVATLTGYSGNWVRTIVHRYNAAGEAGLADRRHTAPGQPPLLSPPRRSDLAVALAGPPPDGGLWTGPKVAAWMAARLARPVHPQRGWEALRSLGFTPQQPRPRATMADPAAQDTFQKGGSRPRSMR